MRLKYPHWPDAARWPLPYDENLSRGANRLKGAFHAANQRLNDAVAADHALRGMATTAAAVLVSPEQVALAHVGDSRAYLYGDGELYQLTHDDTLVAEMVSRGEIQPEQVAGHRFRHVITNVVGGNETGIHVEAHALDVRAGERLLLCSNGLTGMVTDDVIAAVLETELDPEAAATKLVALANEAGGSDNVTVLIVRFDAVAPELAKS